MNIKLSRVLLTTNICHHMWNGLLNFGCAFHSLLTFSSAQYNNLENFNVIQTPVNNFQREDSKDWKEEFAVDFSESGFVSWPWVLFFQFEAKMQKT